MTNILFRTDPDIIRREPCINYNLMCSGLTFADSSDLGNELQGVESKVVHLLRHGQGLRRKGLFMLWSTSSEYAELRRWWLGWVQVLDGMVGVW